jgi:hypothetical protein
MAETLTRERMTPSLPGRCLLIAYAGAGTGKLTGRMSTMTWDRLVRWSTPLVFLLATLALALPSVSLRWAFADTPLGRFESTYSGLDPAVNGAARTVISSQDETGRWREIVTSEGLLTGADPAARAVMLVALIVLAAGLTTVTLRGRMRAAVSLAAATLAAATVTAAMTWTADAMRRSPAAVELFGSAEAAGRQLEFRYGFWLVLGLLVVVAAVNALAIAAAPGRRRDEPLAAAVAPGTPP